MFESTLFWIFATVAIGAALGVVLAPSVLYSALSLIVVFFSIAAFFLLNNADFLATAQVLVYGVGLTIVMLFGIMFTGDTPLKTRAGKLGRLLIASISSVALFALIFTSVLGFNIKQFPASAQWIRELHEQGSTLAIGQLLFSKYVLPFEVASILLLGAMIGAIMLSKKTFTSQEPGLTFSIQEGRLKPTLSAEWRKDVGFVDAEVAEEDAPATEELKKECSL
ncbi:MAG: NADH-quinone oxidoreductase subunit J [Vampirovibrionales bacterium]|nr:NADH-quinone oxidoreductase subunit J [Vampirovibrionales bacterium]